MLDLSTFALNATCALARVLAAGMLAAANNKLQIKTRLIISSFSLA